MTVKDFDSCLASCGIYLIRNLVNQSVYIGQTTRLFKQRWKEYISIANNTKATKNISLVVLAIRKYGIENFDFSILEECDRAKLDDREQFWIKVFEADSHNNYNQTAGGQQARLKVKQPLWVSALFKDLSDNTLSIKELALKYNLSIGHIYDINYGYAHHDAQITYPIRSLDKKDQYKLIAQKILNSSLSLEEIAKVTNFSLSMVRRVNGGKGAYNLTGYTYPLRNNVPWCSL